MRAGLVAGVVRLWGVARASGKNVQENELRKPVENLSTDFPHKACNDRRRSGIHQQTG